MFLGGLVFLVVNILLTILLVVLMRGLGCGKIEIRRSLDVLTLSKRGMTGEEAICLSFRKRGFKGLFFYLSSFSLERLFYKNSLIGL